MAPRPDFQDLLENLLGSEEVYFQPPKSIRLQYPCIIYTVSDLRSVHADNMPFQTSMGYNVTVVDRNPDSPVAMAVSAIQSSRFVRNFVSDNLNHFVFNIFF
jgi:hypothetical protein